MGHPGRALHVDPIKPTLTAPGTKRLKLKSCMLLSSFAFKFNLRRYILEEQGALASVMQQAKVPLVGS